MLGSYMRKATRSLRRLNIGWPWTAVNVLRRTFSPAVGWTTFIKALALEAAARLKRLVVVTWGWNEPSTMRWSEHKLPPLSLNSQGPPERRPLIDYLPTAVCLFVWSSVCLAVSVCLSVCLFLSLYLSLSFFLSPSPLFFRSVSHFLTITPSSLGSKCQAHTQRFSACEYNVNPFTSAKTNSREDEWSGGCQTGGGCQKEGGCHACRLNRVGFGTMGGEREEPRFNRCEDS